MALIYKLLAGEEWRAARASGTFAGSAVDLADGFIHFSTGEQLRETARRHFAGRPGLVCFAVEAESLNGLVWEPSRGGDLFPHLYGALDIGLVIDEWPAPLDEHGIPQVTKAEA